MVDVDKIVWRTVTADEYYRADFNAPHRSTYTGTSFAARYELGTLPKELPTKRGAIIEPTEEWVDDDEYLDADVFFLFDGRDWLEISRSDWVVTSAALVYDALNAGGMVMFNGLES